MHLRPEMCLSSTGLEHGLMNEYICFRCRRSSFRRSQGCGTGATSNTGGWLLATRLAGEDDDEGEDDDGDADESEELVRTAVGRERAR